MITAMRSDDVKANQWGNLNDLLRKLMTEVRISARNMAKIKGTMTGLRKARATPVAMKVKISRQIDCRRCWLSMMVLV